MNRHLGKVYFMNRIIGSFFVLALSACSNRQSPPVVVSTPAGTESATDSTTYDTSETTDLFGDATSASTTTNSNLFDTSTSQDPGSATTPNTTVNSNSFSVYDNTHLSNQQSQCLSGNLLGSPNPTALSPACYNSSTGLTSSQLLTMGSQSFGTMGLCLDLVLSRAAPYCRSGAQPLDAQNMAVLFQSSQMGLVRCFRNIIRQQMSATQWMPQQQQSYQNNDSMLHILLKLFSQGTN